MKAFRLPLLGLIGALTLGAAPGLAHAAVSITNPSADLADPTHPLSAVDARLYAQAFEAVRHGEFARGEALGAQVSDTCLIGRLRLIKLMAPGYHADYAELSDWLQAFRDQPEADRVFTLAKKRRPVAAASSDAVATRLQSSPSAYDAAAQAAPPIPAAGADPRLQLAREAFYGGDLQGAYAIAHEVGEHWVGGLAAYRLNRYAEALEDFSALLDDPAQNEWVRSSAAYWAARASTASGRPQAAPAFLRIAARTPYTFYGLIAERQLGLDSSLSDPRPPAPLDTAAPVRLTPLTPLSAEAADLILSDARAHRAAAFAQVGLRLEAGLEARTAMLGAGPGPQRKAWQALASTLGAPLSSPGDAPRQAGGRFDLAQFPTPELNPEGGYTQDKALIYALVRQESRFNASAASASGAYGLMQLMPATAARLSGDAKLAKNPSALLDARKNLKLGQAYVGRLLDQVQGDLVRAVAAYNSGPGTILKTGKALGDAADTLMVVESMPGGQTREYVQKVMANYWIYRQILGRTTTTLDAAASGARGILASLDR